MNKLYIAPKLLEEYEGYLVQAEREAGTIEKYLRDVKRFTEWLGNQPVTKETVANWKRELSTGGYRPTTINSMLSAVNSFFSFAGWRECKVKYLRIQRKLFCSQEKELSHKEYERLLNSAHDCGRERLALLMETICSTGIRVSEVQYITVEAAERQRTEVALKGKIRTILLPGKLCRKLLKYAKKKKITSGEIFLTRSGKGLSRRQIWSEMKALCARTEISCTKVYPHNLRHLFARTFYRASRDVAKLADIMGHSSIETTRIYLISTGVEHARQMERLGLVS